MSTRSGSQIQQTAGYKAFMPKPLPPNPVLKIDSTMQKLLSEADRSLARLDALGHVLPNPDLFVAMFVKKEAVLSSQIEGTQASLHDVLEFEAGLPTENIEDVAEAVSYVKAMNYSLDRLKKLPLSLRLLRETHERLMRNARGKTKSPGEFRKTQNWIGPPGSTLNNAKFIPPPPHALMDSLGALEKFIHREGKLPVLVACGLIHAQFETIHPFLDGNGRMGRLLITLYLCWKEVLNRPLLYISNFFKQNRLEYYDRLNAVRTNGDWEGWIMFFLKAVEESSREATQSAKEIIALRQRHFNLLVDKEIAAPASLKIFELLFAQPVLSVKDIVEELGVSKQTAHIVTMKFLGEGLLTEITGQQRSRVFAYKDYLAIIEEGTKL